MCNLGEGLVEETIRKEIKKFLRKGKIPQEIHEFGDYSLELIQELTAPDD